jgi:hypothetical protein
MTDRRHKACLRLDAALRNDHEAGALAPAARERLRELARRLLCVPDDGPELVQQAAALLSGLVAERALSDETADLLWLYVAACAATRRWTSAAELVAGEPTADELPTAELLAGRVAA